MMSNIELWLDQALAQNHHAPPPFEKGEEIDVSTLGLPPEIDQVFIIWQPLNAVFWPMVLHKHANECGRA